MWDDDQENNTGDAALFGWMLGLSIAIAFWIIAFPIMFLIWSYKHPRTGLIIAAILSSPFFYSPQGGPRAYAVYRAQYTPVDKFEYVVQGGTAYFYAANLMIVSIARPVLIWIAKILGFSTCTKTEERKLQIAVKAACNLPHKCLATHDCPILIEHQLRTNRCIVARSIIMQQCFFGGDKTHKDTLKRERVALTKCNTQLIAKQCL